MKIVRDKRNWGKISGYGIAAVVALAVVGLTARWKAVPLAFFVLFATRFMQKAFPARRGVDD